ncbi:MAG: NAD+ synthase [Methanobacteriota archaeon]|nr:MAG: NAD+ synthase [Euryarchaeota archaeon]
MDVIRHFLSEKLRKTGSKGYVLGVSGGMDSAVVLKLATKAVGNGMVLALLMPDKDSSRDDVRLAKTLCEAEGVRYKIIDISAMMDAFRGAVGRKAGRGSLANAKARARMMLLYHYAGTERRLVLGTTNKSELLIGYFTKYGDGGADLEPIGDLYKTDVRRLAERLEVPKEIMDRPPSAGLWKGQTDEEDIGLPYEKLDVILRGIELAIDERTNARRADVPVGEVRRISDLVRLSSHKRKFPPVAKIGYRTPGFDWREGDEDL